jgi:Sulfotransferase domain
LTKLAESIDVLYIAGSGRCGSTLLSQLLGQYDGVFDAGEVVNVWALGIVGGGRCGCGAQLTSCDVWASIFDRAFGGFERAEAQRMAELTKWMRARNEPLAASRVAWRYLLSKLRDYPDRIGALYAAIADVFPGQLIVDSSKDPLYAAVVREDPRIRMCMAHIVRDPRAASFSWRQSKRDLGFVGEVNLPEYGAFTSAAIWILSNEAAAAYGRRHPGTYVAVRYEDFVAHPLEKVNDIGRILGRSFSPDPIEGDCMRLQPTHSAWGNPNRFAGSSVRLVRDDRWRREMRRSDRLLVGTMTAPWRIRYDYPRDPG